MKTILRIHVLILFLLLFMSFGCSKQNPALNAVLHPVDGRQNEMANYPHPVTWKNQHIDIMSKNNLEVTCLQCHKNNLGAPLKVSCAIQCHHADSETLPPKTPPTPVVNKCTICHSAVTDNKFGHFPANAGLCTTCHTVSAKHLNENGNDPVKTKATANDCYTCHMRKDNEANVHPALLDESSCVTCHNPHGGNQRFFLQDYSKDKNVTIKAMCTQCHTTNLDEMSSKHGAIENERSCLNCHNPHSSKHEKILKMPAKDLCLSCHDKTMQATLGGARVIPNIKEKVMSAKKSMGSCTDCHNPHGTKFNRLLVDNYSLENYNQYPQPAGQPDPYALCATCHYVEGTLSKDDLSGTQFKTATKNLHWKHVVEETKSCRVCHDPHGSTQESFIRESFKMNDQDIPVKFTKTANGGSCVTCHTLKSYERE